MLTFFGKVASAHLPAFRGEGSCGGRIHVLHSHACDLQVLYSPRHHTRTQSISCFIKKQCRCVGVDIFTNKKSGCVGTLFTMAYKHLQYPKHRTNLFKNKLSSTMVLFEYSRD